MTATPEPSDDLDRQIGDRVHTLLFRRRMRQRPLAVALGVTPSVLSKKLRGESAWSARQVWTAAGVLGVPVGELYGDSGQWAPRGSNPQPTDYQAASSARVVNLAARRARRAGGLPVVDRRIGLPDRRVNGSCGGR